MIKSVTRNIVGISILAAASMQAQTSVRILLGVGDKGPVRWDGTITAQQVEILGDAGAYPNLSPRVLFAAAACACGPYRVPNASISSTAVFTNNLPASAFRGFGAMQIVLGYESQMDELAARLGLSRTELRERNFLAKGDLLPTGERLDTCVEVAQYVKSAAGQ